MKIAERLPALFVTVILVGGIAIVASRFLSPSADGATVSVRVPALSATALAGQEAFDANCVACHGPNGAGTDQGPPLVHDIYNPGHHSDQAFFLAAKRGVGAHHWNFGDMPPLPRVNNDQIAAIVRYVRELQQANGINYKAHRM